MSSHVPNVRHHRARRWQRSLPLAIEQGLAGQKLALILLIPIILFGGFGGGLCIFFALVIKIVPFFVYLFPGLFLLFASFIGICSAWLFFGHITIRLNSERIRRTFWLGPFPLATGTCPVDSLKRLAVINWPEEDTNDLVASGMPQGACTLAWKYPNDVVSELAGELVARLQSFAGRKEIYWDHESMAFTGERPIQPARSRVSMEDTDTGLILKIPRQGMFGPVVFLFFFGLFFISPTVFVICHMVKDANASPMLVIFLVSAAIGLVIWWIALHLAYRRLEFEVREGELVMRRIGLHGIRENAWTREEVVAVAAVREQRKRSTQHGGSYSYWVHLLRIFLADGSNYDIEGRYGMHPRTVPAEWEWIATILRGSLGLPAWPTN